MVVWRFFFFSLSKQNNNDTVLSHLSYPGKCSPSKSNAICGTGIDGVGVVESVPAGSKFSVGQEVGFTSLSSPTFAEVQSINYKKKGKKKAKFFLFKFVVVPEIGVMPIPAGWSLKEFAVKFFLFFV